MQKADDLLGQKSIDLILRKSKDIEFVYGRISVPAFY
jgi:hypothetical protein